MLFSFPSDAARLWFGNIRKHLGTIFHELARQKECQIIEGHLMVDHVHRCISIPPKYAVASVIGFIKGKSAIAIARQFQGRYRNFTGEHCSRAWLLCFDGRVRRREGESLHPRARGQR